MRFADKLVLVTGGGGGIGRATAQLFAAEGASLIVADRNAAGGRAAAAAIEKAGGKATFIQCDVSDAEQVRRMCAEIAADIGGLDVLVNNAGMQIVGKSIEETSEDEWEQMHGTNLKGVFLVSKYAIPQLRRRGGGSIVNVASLQAQVTMPGFAVYAASKAGVVGLTRGMALDLLPNGIRVNAVLPGAVDTPMARAYFEENDLAFDAAVLKEPQRVGRFSDGEEIAEVIAYLASDASRFIVGATVVADGGQHAMVGFSPD